MDSSMVADFQSSTTGNNFSPGKAQLDVKLKPRTATSEEREEYIEALEDVLVDHKPMLAVYRHPAPSMIDPAPTASCRHAAPLLEIRDKGGSTCVNIYLPTANADLHIPPIHCQAGRISTRSWPAGGETDTCAIMEVGVIEGRGNR